MSAPYYHARRWRRLAAACIARDPICTTPGCGRPSSYADHIRPRQQGGGDDLSNLRGLCDQCHNRRSAKGNAEPRVIGCDASGAPRDPGHWWRTMDDKPIDNGGKQRR
jgi:5-methylcytosine-specific restriction protein A